MAVERLLERISNSEAPVSREGIPEQERAVDSVLGHLYHVLNTRQGSVPIAEEYGIPTFSSMSSRFSTENLETTEDIASAILKLIQNYEPRLINTRTHFEKGVEHDLALRFEIKGEVLFEKGNIPVTIKAYMDPKGEIHLSL
jgi:type VI secretion system protein